MSKTKLFDPEFIGEKNSVRAGIIEITWLTGMNTGWGNGYIFLPKNHKWFGLHYDNIKVEAHGGLTYADLHGEYWVIGFDCAHYGDIAQNKSKEWLIKETFALMNRCAKKKLFTQTEIKN